ncbi:cytochrome P450 [Truncatella angustata]|uniref:Cytochrome P450 n=1 Tax=Truncatella angustata TaxID=152316 RepID=A0A9P8REN9_9PEZI|nr:cytochrome P450 [Truncatella angustata]KAH6639942.1 cytochrome P450 [Truncatella angustata]
MEDINTFGLFATLAITVALSYPLYAIYLHPLRDIPGPKLSAISRIPYWLACLRGNQVRYITSLHRNYGSVVRFGPNDLSYADGRAWKDIAGVQKGKSENGKEVKFHAPSANGTPNLVTENDQERHAAIRRVFSPAFSEKALRAQEPMFQKYADLVVKKGRGAGTINMTELLNWATFDIMAELAFGESLGLLERGAYSSWIAIVFKSVKVLPFIQMIEFYPALKKIYDLIEPRSIAAMRLDHFNHTVSRVDKRLKEGSDNPDLWNLVVESNILTLKEMHTNAELFMLAGTETTASLLTGLTYHLIMNPDKRKMLTDEIRKRFNSSRDITFETLAQLDYLNACIREGLRVYPSIPSGIPREIAKGGNRVLGKWIPEGTRVSVHQFATYHSPANFRDPDSFVPERWLGDPEYEGDNRDSHQPFSVGPRNCLGMNLAWHEMRILLGTLLYNFDLESDVGPDWLDQKVYVIWDRKPLLCRLIPAPQT